MGYILNEDQKSLVAMAHDFCEKEIKPYAAQWDRDGVFPLESYKKAMEIGYHCLEIPEEYGGGGIDYVTVAAVMEEFAKYDLGFATTLMGTTLSLKPVLMHGTPEQKKMYADVIVGGGLGAFALTEAGAGSDAAACRTTFDAEYRSQRWLTKSYHNTLAKSLHTICKTYSSSSFTFSCWSWVDSCNED